ncbi:MAG: glycosyltransferase family 39 protein [Bacteroidota bacterium]|nr:glycosyltransferase family 39 protein [Bacteroidota bacterium]MDP4233793.1 glycosyltransferase family 39 protein [Bacteroidota bacterium]MDP4242432.1 glycosyltransferase family 39 protein [Bacteroidota bacterium]MDP4287554.1 glycosyltransferase family 39 protein [Bacteroidota bacterium]
MQSVWDEAHDDLKPRVHESGTVSVHASDTGALGSLSYRDPLAILGTMPYPEEPWWQRLSPSTIFVLLASAIAVLFLGHELLIAGDLGFPKDQAWTDQVYARNFFHHIDFEFNSGDRTASPSAPFWIVFLSFGLGLFHDPLIAGKLLGAVFLFLAGYYSFRALKAIGIEHAAALLGGTLIMTAPAMAWAELSGLETCLASALILGAIWWLVAGSREHEKHHWTHGAIAGGIFALAALTRPESAIIFITVLINALFTSPRPWKNAGIMLSVFVLTIAPIGITNFAIGGTFLPPSFLTGITTSSAISLIGSGEFQRSASQIFLSVVGILVMIRDVYLPENPLWIITILLAFISRWRRPLIRRDAVDSLLSLVALVLVIFPYIRALLFGTSASGTSHESATAFVLPLYQLAGILSLVALVRRELFRSVTTKQILSVMAIAVLALGLTLGLGYEAWNALEFVLLLLLTGLFYMIALRHAGIRLGKPELGHIVLEADRMKMTFHRDEDMGAAQLSEPTIRVLRGVLLIALAANMALLPHVAHKFGHDVQLANTTEVKMARVIASMTQPNDIIATNAPGAMGFFSERRVLDLSGTLMPMDDFSSAKYLAWFGDPQTKPEKSALKQEFAIDSKAVLYRYIGWP